MTIPRLETDAEPSRCAVCGELEHSPHVFCAPINRPKAPAPPSSSPAVKPGDSPTARRANAIVEARTLLTQLAKELDYLGALRPGAPIESAHDRRFRDTAHGRIEHLAVELGALMRRVRVARDG